jgi:hypothetical protein
VSNNQSVTEYNLEGLAEFFGDIAHNSYNVRVFAYNLYHAHLVEYTYGDTPGGHITESEDLDGFDIQEDLRLNLQRMADTAREVAANIDRLLARPDLVKSITVTVANAQKTWGDNPEDFGHY